MAEEQDFKCNHCGKAFSPPNNFHIDHIDGDSSNNERNNLQAIHPNCHNIKTIKQEKTKRDNRKKEIPKVLRDPLGFNNEKPNSWKSRKKKSDDPFNLGDFSI